MLPLDEVSVFALDVFVWVILFKVSLILSTVFTFASPSFEDAGYISPIAFIQHSCFLKGFFNPLGRISLLCLLEFFNNRGLYHADILLVESEDVDGLPAGAWHGGGGVAGVKRAGKGILEHSIFFLC